MSILTVCLNPVLQKTLVFSSLREGEVNRAAENHIHASGKGINVSRVLSWLGDSVIHLTHLGSPRETFLSLLRELPVRLEYLPVDSPLRTCSTLLNTERGSVTELVEEGPAVPANLSVKIEERFLELLPLCSAVVISGSKAAGYSDGLFSRLVHYAKAAGKTVLLDYRKEDLLSSLPEGPDYIKPNLDEFKETFFSGKIGIPDRLIGMKCREIYRDFGTISILSDGSRPVRCFDGREFRSFPVPSQPVLNTIGCGDAFAAGFIHTVTQEGSVEEAVREGIRCAGLNAGTLLAGSLLQGPGRR